VKTARTHRNLQVLKLCANLSAGIGNGIPTQTGLITLWCHACCPDLFKCNISSYSM